VPDQAGGRAGEAQESALAVDDQNGVRVAGLLPSAGQRKAAPEKGMRGIGYLDLLQRGGKWVLERGINKGNRRRCSTGTSSCSWPSSFRRSTPTSTGAAAMRCWTRNCKNS